MCIRDRLILRKCPNSHCATTPEIANSHEHVINRKRKPSVPGNLGRSTKKRPDPSSKMIRSPADNKKAANSGNFRLDAPKLVLNGAAAETQEQTESPIDPVNLENSGTLDMSSDLLLGDSAADIQGSVQEEAAQNTAGSGKATTSQAGDSTEDPFAKLHKLMEMNFASMRSDNHTMFGQLGMLQNNVSNLNSTVNTMKTDFDGLNARLTNVTAQAVANKCGISNINKQLKDMQSKQTATITEKVAETVAKEIEKAGIGAAAAIPEDVARRMDKMDKELDKMKALHAVQQISAAGQRSGSQSIRRSSAAEDESSQYWAARRKIRCSPVDLGSSNDEALANAYGFLEDVLAMPRDDIPDGSIVNVKRVPGRKKELTQKEVIVTFTLSRRGTALRPMRPTWRTGEEKMWRGRVSA